MSRVVFRVDASRGIGTGHLMRCLTLADEFKRLGNDVSFICRRLEGHLGAYLVNRGYESHWIEQSSPLTLSDWESDAECTAQLLRQCGEPCDLLIVDHYGIDHHWEDAVRPYSKRIAVIDDLANRVHSCELLLDQNVYADMDTRYEQLVPSSCRLLLGPKYLLLRPSFYEARRMLRSRDGSVQKLLIFFGGSDPTNETAKALEALSMMKDDARFLVDVVIGEANPYKEEVVRLCSNRSNLSLHIQVENMAELIAEADFALGAGGVAMWERCYLGLPSAVAIVADNQQASVETAALQGAVWNAGSFKHTTAAVYAELLRKAIASPSELRLMSCKGLAITESEAASAFNRAAAEMLHYIN